MMQTPQIAASIKALALLILLHHLCTQVSSVDTLKQGESLDSSSQLVSANGIFTLRFYTPRGTNNTYLAIWFKDVVAWIGNREEPVPSSSSPSLTVGMRGELSITHGRGEAVQLYAGGSGRNVTASLLNTGNLVVTSDRSSDILWESFDHPTDTFLTGMKLGRSGTSSTLSSWKVKDFNPAPGAFTLEWDPSTRNLLVRRKGIVYWRSGELKNHTYTDGIKRIAGFDVNYWNYYNFTAGVDDFLIFSFITSPDAPTSGWRLNDEGSIEEINHRPYTVAEPGLCYNYYTKSSAGIAGCEPREQPECRNENDAFGLRSGGYRGNTFTVHFDQNSNLSLNDCQEACWKDCDCSAYRGGEGGGCTYWKGKNLDFVQTLAGVSFPIYVIGRAPSSKGMKKYVLIILTVLSSVVLLIFGITLFLVRKYKRGKKEEELRELLTLEGYTETSELENGGAKNQDLKFFTYASIMSATRNFSSGNKLGEGGFGPVYEGKTAEGQDIAVKLLSRLSGQGLLEFKTELILISKLQHVNLVKLLGFCVHGDDKMIVYEYMQNKSLDFFLFNPSKREQLDWQKRFNIIEGTAQGLLYLHKYSRLRIIHRDLKPNNILLDENMNPKISDFGLARIFKQNVDEANTNRRVGTYGYMAPEYAMQGIFSVKSDVYSFGVLVLEIVSGRKNNCFHQVEGPLNLVEYAWEHWRNDSAIELMDPTLKDTCIIDQLQRCIHIGLLCVENHAVDRPKIEGVISMLKNEATSLPMPKSPAFITRNSVLEEVAKSIPEKLLSSANEVTLSEMEGR